MKLEETYEAFIQFAEYFGWEYTAINVYKWFGEFRMQECVEDLYNLHDLDYRTCVE